MLSLVFWLSYALAFCIGGLITFFGVPFRLAYVSFLPLIMIPFLGVKLSKAFTAFIIFFLYIVFSGLANKMSSLNIVLFFRYVITPFSMYFLVTNYLTSRNIKRVLWISIAVAMIQLPTMLIERAFYTDLVRYSAVSIERVDFDFGTFMINGDPAMTFLLLSVLVFLLFDGDNNQFVKRKTFKIAWLTATVLLSDSEMSHLILIGIWLYYVSIHANLKKAASVVGASLLVAILIFSTSSWKEMNESVEDTIKQLSFSDVNEADERAFLEGKYSRQAAVLYYLNEPMKLIGDGPSKYYNAIEKENVVGNTGQLFTFYSEIGLLGMLIGYGTLLIIALDSDRVSTQMRIPCIISIVAFTATTSVMSDVSMMLTFNLFMSTNLLSAPKSITRKWDNPSQLSLKIPQ